MHRSAVYITLLALLPFNASAQCVLNGSFENWDSTDYTPPIPYMTPYEWVWALPNTPCSPANFLVTSDTISHIGNLSAKLESKVCMDDLGNSRLEEGILFSGGPYFAPRSISFPCPASPSQLNFQYKFHQEGSDTAYVKVMLFNYDSLTPGLFFSERIDTVAFSSGYMHQETTEFTPFLLPINYLSSDTPAFIHIYFSTSKTLAEHYGNTPPFLYAYPGTTLWIDDVNINGGNVGMIDNGSVDQPLFYPNPANDVLYLRQSTHAKIYSMILTDLHGREVMDSFLLSDQLDIGGLSPGMYFVRYNLSTGQRCIDKLLVE